MRPGARHLGRAPLCAILIALAIGLAHARAGAQCVMPFVDERCLDVLVRSLEPAPTQDVRRGAGWLQWAARVGPIDSLTVVLPEPGATAGVLVMGSQRGRSRMFAGAPGEGRFFQYLRLGSDGAGGTVSYCADSADGRVNRVVCDMPGATTPVERILFLDSNHDGKTDWFATPMDSGLIAMTRRKGGGPADVTLLYDASRREMVAALARNPDALHPRTLHVRIGREQWVTYVLRADLMIVGVGAGREAGAPDLVALSTDSDQVPDVVARWTGPGRTRLERPRHHGSLKDLSVRDLVVRLDAVHSELGRAWRGPAGRACGAGMGRQLPIARFAKLSMPAGRE